MFYSTNIISLKMKTALSVIYYISTTNNRNNKINKKDIENISILNTIESLKNPPQPFALRLYAYLLKGIVRVYKLKLGYFENEVVALLKSLKLKRKRPEKPCINKIEFVDELSKIESSHEQMRCTNSSVIEFDTFIENTMNNEFNNDLQGEIQNFLQNKRIKRVIEDKVLELTEEQLYMQFNKITPTEEHKEEAFIVSEINRKIKELNTLITTEINDDFFGDFSSVEKPRHSSLSSFNADTTCLDEITFEENNTVNTALEGVLADSKTFCFNKITRNFNRRDKAEGFLRVLELLNQEKVEVYQEGPYSDIYITMVQC